MNVILGYMIVVRMPIVATLKEVLIAHVKNHSSAMAGHAQVCNITIIASIDIKSIMI